MAISRYHETSVGCEAEHLLITDTLTHLPLTFGVLVVVDSYRVTAELSCGDELLHGFLDRSRWQPALRP
jgi:hypothetical protein